MLYGLLTYKAHPAYNVGDYIQSLAAAQYLPRIDKYVNRERLSIYNEETLALIMNGWYMHKPGNWPPSSKIVPLVTSFHMSPLAKHRMLSKSGIIWFKKNGPIGCRDENTLKLMNESGIEAYLSGCLTSTFKNKWNYRTDDIYFVDPFFRIPDWADMKVSPKIFVKSLIKGNLSRGSRRHNLLEEIFDGEVLSSAKYVRHYHSFRHTEAMRFALAEDYLHKYATAKLVVTSRLHCAIPCLAFGTPVIFLNAGFRNIEDSARLDWITQWFNTITVDDKQQISSNFAEGSNRISTHSSLRNSDTFKQLAFPLEQICREFINKVNIQA